MNLRNAQPILDQSIKQFINSLDTTDFLYDENISNEFVENFYNWINSSKNNNLLGLDKFTNRKITAGTIQAFDHWYWRHKNRTIRFFKGEFMYHQAVLKNGGVWEYIDNRRLQKHDAVVISVPFSDWGEQRDDLLYFLHNCNVMNIPVMLDFAYYPCAKDIDINLSEYECIDTIAFSISKAFYGAEFLRVGMRLEKNDTDDAIDVFNSVNMHNRVSLGIANKLINKYSIDHNWNTYNTIYTEVCKEHNLTETDCVMFGLGGKEWKHMNRGTFANRVCVSNLIGEKLASTK